MSGNFTNMGPDLRDTYLPDVTQAQREAAMLIVCDNASGLDDARQLLRTLGLL